MAEASASGDGSGSAKTSTAGAAGDLLLHPLSLVSLGGLLLNDHLLKAAAAGTPWNVVTGKLSDFCGVCFLPFLLVAAVELVEAAVGSASPRGSRRGPRVFVAVVAAVGVAVFFALTKTSAFFGDVYAVALGALQWPFHALRAGAFVPLRAVSHVVDPSDVVAVPCAFVVVAVQLRRASAPRAGRAAA